MLDRSDPHSLVSKPFWRLLGTWGGSIRYSTSEWRNSSGVPASTGWPLALHLWLSHPSTSWLLSHLAVTAEAYCGLFCLILVRCQPRSLTKAGSSWLWAMMLTPPDLCCVLHHLPNKAGLSFPWFLPSSSSERDPCQNQGHSIHLPSSEDQRVSLSHFHLLFSLSLCLQRAITSLLWRSCKVASSKRIGKDHCCCYLQCFH